MTRWEVLPPNVKVQSTIGNVKQVSAAGKAKANTTTRLRIMTASLLTAKRNVTITPMSYCL